MSSQTDTISTRTIILGTLVVLLAMGVRATFGLFMQPMGLAHGWGREVFSMAFALQNLVWGVACIFMGILADRYGSGRTIALGAVLYMLGMIGTRFATDETTLYLTAGVLVGLGQAGTTFPVILPVVASMERPNGSPEAANRSGAVPPEALTWMMQLWLNLHVCAPGLATLRAPPGGVPSPNTSVMGVALAALPAWAVPKRSSKVRSRL